MKKILCAMFAVLALFCGCAFAAGDYLGPMQVVNCEEWVSLRAEPDTKSERLLVVPRGEVVSECYDDTGSFVRCEYMGQTGYILEKYLAPASYEMEKTVYQQVMDYGYGHHTAYYENGWMMAARRAFFDATEQMLIYVFDAYGNVAWGVSATSDHLTELDQLSAFTGGTDEEPIVFFYRVGEGLTAYDLYTGELRWFLSSKDCDLGAAITWAVDDEGITYIGGYYGPDPVAISPYGEVLRSYIPECEAYWLFDIHATAEGLVVSYDHIEELDYCGEICFDYAGHQLWVK